MSKKMREFMVDVSVYAPRLSGVPLDQLGMALATLIKEQAVHSITVSRTNLTLKLCVPKEDVSFEALEARIEQLQERAQELLKLPQ